MNERPAKLRSSALLMLAGLALSAIAARALLLGRPMVNVDDQFYLLVGERVLGGALPYVDIWDRKPPGLFLLYTAIRWIGGNQSVWPLHLIAIASIVATAWTIRTIALQIASPAGAAIAALAYTWWTALTGGGTGQAAVFYNLPMALAALLIVQVLERPTDRPMLGRGCAAMLLAGLAFEIKSSAVIEAALFGLTLLWLFWRAHPPRRALAMAALCAMAFAAPTLVVLACYAAVHALDALLYATVLSLTERTPMAARDYWVRFAASQAIILPLLAFAAWGSLRLGDNRTNPPARFLYLWLAVAWLASFAFRGHYFDHYVLPVLVPGCICAARLFSHPHRYRWALGMTAAAVAVANFALQAEDRGKSGGWRSISALDAATDGQRNCPLVYDGPPIAAVANDWCAVTPWEFPLHLSYKPEAGAIGTDPRAEIARILATRPDRIVFRAAPNRQPNVATRTLVQEALARDYHLVATIAPDGLQVYALDAGLRPLPNAVPNALATHANLREESLR